ncbi:MAG: 2-oxoglutarate dehydrogenase E1 component, partial [Rhodospirillales bacterium]|nr:2-oxoglutarate dehydrogenase E1 component [Rhodospirillales bacterium]
MAGVDVIATAMNGANAQFIAQLYAKWADAPNSVDPDFAALFAALDDDTRAIFTDASGASWAPRPSVFETVSTEAAPRPAQPPALADTHAATLDSIRALMLIRAYRVRGHLEARLDPLGLKQKGNHSELDPASYGFTEAGDMDRPIFLDGVLGFDTATLREVMAALRQSYCG